MTAIDDDGAALVEGDGCGTSATTVAATDDDEELATTGVSFSCCAPWVEAAGLEVSSVGVAEVLEGATTSVVLPAAGVVIPYFFFAALRALLRDMSSLKYFLKLN